MKSSRRQVFLGVIAVLLVLYLRSSHASNLNDTSRVTNSSQEATIKQSTTDGSISNITKDKTEEGDSINNTNSTNNETKSTVTRSKVTSNPKDGVFESSGELLVQIDESGSGDGASGSGESEAQIKLNGRRLHSIQEAITKLLNSGRQRLENLKKGTFPSPYRREGPVVRAYVSDSAYDTPLHHKNHRHRRGHPRFLFRGRQGLLDGRSSFIYPSNDNHEQLEYTAPVKKPYYVLYPDQEPARFSNIPQYQETNPYQEQQQQYDTNMEETILRNYALQQEIAGLSSNHLVTFTVDLLDCY